MNIKKLQFLLLSMLLVSPMIVEAKKKKVVSKKTQKRHKSAKKANLQRLELSKAVSGAKSNVDLVINTYNNGINSATASAAIGKIDEFIATIDQTNATLKAHSDKLKRNNKTMKHGGSSAGTVTADEKKKIKNNNNMRKANKQLIITNNAVRAEYQNYKNTISNLKPVAVQTIDQILATAMTKIEADSTKTEEGDSEYNFELNNDDLD